MLIVNLCLQVAPLTLRNICLSDGTAGEEQNLAYDVEQSAVDA